MSVTATHTTFPTASPVSPPRGTSPRRPSPRASSAAPTIRTHLAPAIPSPSPGLRVRLAQAGPDLWRVLDMTGRIVGHLQHLDHPLGARWAARRYRDGVGGFRTVGEFWSVDEAVSALRGG